MQFKKLLYIIIIVIIYGINYMLTIAADFKLKTNTSESRRLRKKEKCPAIIYKNNQYSNLMITLKYNDIQNPKIIKYLYKNNIIQLIIDQNKTLTVKIQDIQYHAFKPKIIHIDFLLV